MSDANNVTTTPKTIDDYAWCFDADPKKPEICESAEGDAAVLTLAEMNLPENASTALLEKTGIDVFAKVCEQNEHARFTYELPTSTSTTLRTCQDLESYKAKLK